MPRPGITEETKEQAEARVAHCFDGDPPSFEAVVQHLIEYADDLEEQSRRQESARIEQELAPSSMERALAREAAAEVGRTAVDDWHDDGNEQSAPDLGHDRHDELGENETPGRATQSNTDSYY